MRCGQPMLPNVELVEEMPPEDEIALSDDGVEAV
jgi:hypothetical protein